MPANLPPEYFEAEKRFKQASTPMEKIAALEELISTVPNIRVQINSGQT